VVADGNGDGGIFLHILPYIEQDNLYKSALVPAGIDDSNGFLPTYSQWTPMVQQSRVKTYICPSDPTNKDNDGGYASYGANGQIFRDVYPGWGPSLSKFPATLADGTSNTIMFTEKLAKCNSGNYPNNYWPDWGPIFASNDLGDPTGPLISPAFQSKPSLSGDVAICNGGIASSPHTAVINTALGDGSVRAVSNGVSGVTWWAAITPAGGEVLGNDW
jgi:hypothetical protein